MMPDNNDYFALAGEIMRPTNPESMADRVKRHQRCVTIFETSFISYMMAIRYRFLTTRDGD
jgi:hypothetical protein